MCIYIYYEICFSIFSLASQEGQKLEIDGCGVLSRYGPQRLMYLNAWPIECSTILGGLGRALPLLRDVAL